TELHEAWKNPERNLPALAQRFGASFVPSIVRAIARGGEPVIPVSDETEAKSILTNIVAGAKQSVAPTGPAKLGLFGEPVLRPGGVAGILGGIQEETKDPLIRKMLEVGALHTAPATDIQISRKGVKTTLAKLYSPEDQALFGQAKGTLQRFYMEQQFRSSAFHRLSPEMQKKLLDTAFERAGRIIDGRMRQFAQFGQRPDYRRLLRGLIPAVR
ncbi:MAG: hypothetical protein ACRD2L_24695, partial [Terriglobia bacterium]